MYKKSEGYFRVVRYKTAVSRQNEFKNFWDAAGGSLRESQRDSHERKDACPGFGLGDIPELGLAQ